MNNLTFLMPCRIESEDRLKNVITSIGYITHHFPQSTIIIKENDTHSVFGEKALPVIQKIFGNTPTNLHHIFEQSNDQFFYKTRILNDLLLPSEKKVLYNYRAFLLIKCKFKKKDILKRSSNRFFKDHELVLGYF